MNQSLECRPISEAEIRTISRLFPAPKTDVHKAAAGDELPTPEEIRAAGGADPLDSLFESWFQDEPRRPVQKSTDETEAGAEIFATCFPF